MSRQPLKNPEIYTFLARLSRDYGVNIQNKHIAGATSMAASTVSTSYTKARQQLVDEEGPAPDATGGTAGPAGPPTPKKGGGRKRKIAEAQNAEVDGNGVDDEVATAGGPKTKKAKQSRAKGKNETAEQAVIKDEPRDDNGGDTESEGLAKA